MSNYVLGQNKTHVFSVGDDLGRCPACFTSNIKRIGDLNINGTPHPISQCNSCNRMYSGSDGGIAGLVDEARINFGTPNVSFTGSTSSDSDLNQVNYSANYNDGHSGNYHSSQINTNINSFPPVALDYIALGKLDTINNNISSLLSTIEIIIQQNKELMTKLQNDPLISIKKAVSEFNLK